jgi:death-on-curing protein
VSSPNKEPVWVPLRVALAVHFHQVHQHGGDYGLREQGAPLEAALERPRNKYRYEPDADLARIAAAYAFGITKVSHPFLDGNKRAGFLIAGVFLELNGYDVDVSNADAIRVVLAVAAGEMTEEQLADWFRAGMRPLDS